MGFFGAYLFSRGQWLTIDGEAASPNDRADPWLSVVIHDSDIATVRYAPTADGTGEAFLGVTPRVYFEDSDASAPTKPAREARGLSTWATSAGSGHISPETLEPFLAGDTLVEETDDEDDEDDDAEIFVEIKTARFLRALGLPLPPELANLESR